MLYEYEIAMHVPGLREAQDSTWRDETGWYAVAHLT